MTLPKQYGYLNGTTSPRVIKEALGLYGIVEAPGPLNNPIILGWAQEVGPNVGMYYSEDATPWCGLFAAVCVKRAGFETPKIAVRAKAWADWGNPAPRAALGDVLVFDRAGGGHVGFYIGEDATCYHVLGGNQSDQVNIARIEKARCVAARRCPWKVAQPAGVIPITLAAHGAVSKNEA